MQFLAEHWIISGYLIFVVIEQILLLFPGSYPYRFGIPVRKIQLSFHGEEVRDKLAESLVLFRYHINDSRKEVYFRKKLPTGVLGPQMMVGQIIIENDTRMIIRIAPIASLAVIGFFLVGLFAFSLSGIIFSLLLVAFIYLSYRWLAGKLILKLSS